MGVSMRLIIIGGGISGLTAGIFARKHGFNTEIYEMHSIPGGECTGWTRKGYHFDNCIHWLTGTKKDTDLYKLWSEVGALKDVEVYKKPYMFSVNLKDEKFYLYTNIERLRVHMLEISPEDANETEDFINLLKRMEGFKIPTKKPKDMMNILDVVAMIKDFKHIGKDIDYLSSISMEDYSERFRSKIIKMALCSVCPSETQAFSSIFTLATIMFNNGGIPKGGSLEMALRMEREYKSLGGSIKYNKKVDKILVEGGVSKGVLLSDGSRIYSDYIISAVDGNMLLNNLLEGKYEDKVLKMQFENRDKYKVMSSLDIGIGVNTDLSSRDTGAIFEIPELICGTKTFNKICISNYSMENFANKGKSVLRIQLESNDYEYWSSLRRENIEKYMEEKNKVAVELIKRVEEIYEEIRGKVEVYDICTPATYERYCGAYRGGWMSFMAKPGVKVVNGKGIIKGVKNLYLGGQWFFCPGGLPGAALTGKWAVQRLCKDNKINFKYNF